MKQAKTYYVNVRTLREEYGKSDFSDEYKTWYYYSDDVVSSDKLVMPEKDMPKLKEVKTNFDSTKEYINDNNIIVEYVFDNDVFMELSVNGQKAYSDNKFKKEWKFVLDDLEDGDYVIDFTAYTSKKDNISGKDAIIGDSDARLAFSIDTSAPILSLSQKSAESVENVSAIFGANTVITEDDGSYTIEGLTEKSSTLTIDGETDGISVNENGSFSITKKLSDNENYKSHTLKAIDNAGNVTELMVYAVLIKVVLQIKEIELKNNGEYIRLLTARKRFQ